MQKTQEERKLEMNKSKITRLLISNNYNMGVDGFPQFLELAKEYINKGIEQQVDIEMVGTKHRLIGYLTNEKNKKCELMLKYDKTM
jgi:dihydrodipicolinate reductase